MNKSFIMADVSSLKLMFLQKDSNLKV